MDMGIEKHLEEAGRNGTQVKVVAALATTHSDIAAFLVTPFLATCHQGAHHRSVIVLAERGDAVLYANLDTHQFGIAFQSAARRDHVFAGREYPSVELAVLMFLGDRSVLDPD
jgi:hypothetical protein